MRTRTRQIYLFERSGGTFGIIFKRKSVLYTKVISNRWDLRPISSRTNRRRLNRSLFSVWDYVSSRKHGDTRVVNSTFRISISRLIYPGAGSREARRSAVLAELNFPAGGVLQANLIFFVSTSETNEGASIFVRTHLPPPELTCRIGGNVSTERLNATACKHDVETQ